MLAILLLLLWAAARVAALQASANSPCASLCIDSPDISDDSPDSFQTIGDDIVCADTQFSTEKAGQKFERCITCLQQSTFSQGDENDLSWFLYNLRYSFDYCIFGYPNATGVEDNPCATQLACGQLQKVLEYGILDPFGTPQYAYCDVDGGSILTSYYEDCLGCVQADKTHFYLSNFFIALEAGCQQKPAPGGRLGLNTTVFTETAVSIVNPNTIDGLGDTGDDTGPLSNTDIVAVAIGGFVCVLLAAGCFYMQIRRRRNRNRRAARTARTARRSSAWSFRCRTHLTPRRDAFVLDSDAGSVEEKETQSGAYADASMALGSNPVSGYGGLPRRASSKSVLAVTTTELSAPAQVRTPQQRYSPDNYATPASAVSVRSNAPLLNQHRQHRSPDGSDPWSGTGLAISMPSGSSPAMNQAAVYTDRSESGSPWEQPQTAPGIGRSMGSRERPSAVGFGRHVELRNVQTSFPPPPKG